MKINVLITAFAMVTVFGGVLAADPDGKINAVLVAELPSPDANGWYEIGVSNYAKAKGSFDSRTATGIGYVDWQALSDAGLTAGAKVKLVGGVALDDLPDSYEYDFAGLKNVAILDVNLFKKMPIPAGCGAIAVSKKTITKNGTVDGSAVEIAWNTGALTISTCVTNNGWIVAGNNSVNNSLVFTKGMVGSGTCYISGRYRATTFNGPLEFDGTLELSESNQSQTFYVNATNDLSKIGAFRFYKFNNSYTERTYQLIYNPVRSSEDGPSTLRMDMAVADDGISYGGLSEVTGRQRRWAVQLCVCSNNTIEISNMLFNQGPLGLFAGLNAAYTVGGTVPDFDKGFGNVIIGNDEGIVNHCVPMLYPSPQVNLTFKGRFMRYTGSYDATIDYRGESNCVNRAFFDCSNFKGSSSGDDWPRTMYIRGFSPYNLPRRITIPTFAAAQNQTQLTITDSTWTMPLDFSAVDTNEINPNRCETNCKRLDIAASGTVYVINATPAAVCAYPQHRTEYPILTCSTGGETAFAGWNVEFIGSWKGASVSKVVKDTGLYISVKRIGGFAISFR